MINVRRSHQRGHADHGWLDTYHTFSFADYYDSKFMGFRALRVINEDRVAADSGFPPHPHQNMEIITYVVEGALAHKDSMGNASVIRLGDVQRMSAGTGVVHSEYNASHDEAVHLLQIWIETRTRGLAPSYEQRTLPPSDTTPPLVLVASPGGGEHAVTVHQDVRLYRGVLPAGARIEHPVEPGRHLWVQLVRGRIRLGDVTLAAGDGAAISEEATVDIVADDVSELLLFDLA